MLLAIDTATRFISLALYDGTHSSLVAEQTWQSQNNHTIQLAPAVFQLLENCELDISDLTALGVSVGPGSYTGLRIGVSLAKGIASARKLPLIGVTTLDTLAASQPYYQSGGGLVVVVQAGRGRVIVRTYRWRKGQWASRAEPILMDWDGLLQHLDGPAYITGEIDEDGLAFLKAAQARDLPVTIVPGAHRLRRAGFLAQTAWDLWKAADDPHAFDPAKLSPVYVKSEEKADSGSAASVPPAEKTVETPAPGSLKPVKSADAAPVEEPTAGTTADSVTDAAASPSVPATDTPAGEA